eukprot:CAMPEP_0176350278 /NCGR_PEP_ID=MMETSP0126-20121128/9352_1 /TAXON_ID=141414 ORGANISM="Strombidinopsis acuminatum, Strain SPMC142" /NCGR_SAMPLE_ID=MMETSP0126 /ASSEMBLY_ACC=CAM_ASM_000229 /LENGTH=207 /DNA_ID=CAMNT_0017700203 /DNA_START=132 /DNA_END=755 /DNA_ORIENTATION=-
MPLYKAPTADDLNETIRLSATQSFFDNLQSGLVAPLLDIISGKEFEGNLTDKMINLGELMSIDLNVTSIAVPHVSLSNNIPLFDIEAEYNDAILQLADFNLELTFDYAFISDPPILADIGSATIDFKNVTLFVNWTSFMQDVDEYSHPFTLEFNDLYLYADHVDEPFNFHGLNDMSLVLSDLLSTLGNMVRGRIVSMSESQLFTHKV